jgi:hypothetical protein
MTKSRKSIAAGVIADKTRKEFAREICIEVHFGKGNMQWSDMH